MPENVCYCVSSAVVGMKRGSDRERGAEADGGMGREAGFLVVWFRIEYETTPVALNSLEMTLGRGKRWGGSLCFDLGEARESFDLAFQERVTPPSGGKLVIGQVTRVL